MNLGPGAKGLVALLCGFLFALGLGMAGMTDPARVIGFLDVFGRWDPTLMFVMVAAIAVHMPVALWMRRRQRRNTQLTALEGCGVAPMETTTQVIRDPKLLGGALAFGVGWGLVGLCPGPALVAVGAGVPGGAPFVVGMIFGMLFHAMLGRRTWGTQRQPAASDVSTEGA